LVCYTDSVKKDSILLTLAEIAAFSAVIGAVNAFFPSNPGFLQGVFNPYLVVALFCAVVYGKYQGFASLLFSAVIVCLPFPLAVGYLALGRPPDFIASWASLWVRAPVPLAITLIEVYFLGLIRDSLVAREMKSKKRISTIAREKGLVMRQMRVLQTANIELEERISRQEDSITSLYEQIEVLRSLNLSKALQAMLGMVRRFVGATRCSIWEHKPESKRLELAAGMGREEDAETSLADESTIEGWVVRNNMMFSVKMLLEHDSLAKLDTGRSIMTLPISAGRRIWGALTIEEMPFAKYNLYTERLLLLIMALAAPALERAIEYESMIRQEEIDAVTGLPTFSQFYSLFEKEITRSAQEKGTFAVVIFELLNYPTLAEHFGREEALRLLGEIAVMAQALAGPHARFFHYKGEGQLAVLCPNLDRDGASLFCLNVLGKVNSDVWQARGERAYLELILGFSAQAGTVKSPDELLKAAENLLDMQKV
jgi:GGDEF domain-containing protein